MSQLSDDPRPTASGAGKPTLESLLRLKRAERPDPAFWHEFDRGFRQKQLAAVVEPRPWWLGLSLLTRRFTPFALPASAGAAALLAMMVVRSEAPFASRPGSEAESAPLARRSVEPTTSSAAVLADSDPAFAEASTTTEASTVGLVSAPADPALAGSNSPSTTRQTLPVVATLLSLPAASDFEEPTPSQATIAQNLAALRAESPELLSASASTFGETLADSPSSATLGESEPRNAARPLDSRQARLLALADAPSTAASDLSGLRERMVHRLAHDDRAPGSSSRLGVGGDRFSLSF